MDSKVTALAGTADLTAHVDFDALARGEWDVGFLANEPARADRVTFSAPYVVIEGTYLVWKDAPFNSAADAARLAQEINVQPMLDAVIDYLPAPVDVPTMRMRDAAGVG